MRQKSGEGTVSASSLGYLAVRVLSVVGPKLSESAVMPSSYCRARVSAYMVAQSASPLSCTVVPIRPP